MVQRNSRLAKHQLGNNIVTMRCASYIQQLQVKTFLIEPLPPPFLAPCSLFPSIVQNESWLDDALVAFFDDGPHLLQEGGRSIPGSIEPSELFHSLSLTHTSHSHSHTYTHFTLSLCLKHTLLSPSMSLTHTHTHFILDTHKQKNTSLSIVFHSFLICSSFFRSFFLIFPLSLSFKILKYVAKLKAQGLAGGGEKRLFMIMVMTPLMTELLCCTPARSEPIL